MKRPTEAVIEFFDRYRPRPDRVLVAVSGGVDSALLLTVLARWDERPFDIVAGLVDHGLRAETAAEREQVTRLCDELGVPIVWKRVALDPSRVASRGIEDAARTARYRALLEMAVESSSDLIATAHHLTDQAETLLMRLLQRGSLATLRGISRDDRRRGIVRPLLDVSRAEIEREARAYGIDPVLDPMNRDERFLRVRVRRNLLPLLRDEWPSIERDLATLSGSIACLVEAAEPALTAVDEAWSRSGGESSIATDALPEDCWLRREALLRELRRLAPAGRSVSISRLETISRSPNARPTSVGEGLAARVGRGRLIIEGERPRSAVLPGDWKITLTPGGEAARLPGDLGAISLRRLERVPDELHDSGNRQVIGLEGGGAPNFEVRLRRPGDRFRALGAPGSKKLAQFLIDRKIDREERDRVPLVLVDGELAWVAGVEVAESFRAGPGRVHYELRWEAEHEQGNG